MGLRERPSSSSIWVSQAVKSNPYLSKKSLTVSLIALLNIAEATDLSTILVRKNSSSNVHPPIDCVQMLKFSIGNFSFKSVICDGFSFSYSE